MEEFVRREEVLSKLNEVLVSNMSEVGRIRLTFKCFDGEPQSLVILKDTVEGAQTSLTMT